MWEFKPEAQLDNVRIQLWRIIKVTNIPQHAKVDHDCTTKQNPQT